MQDADLHPHGPWDVGVGTVRWGETVRGDNGHTPHSSCGAGTRPRQANTCAEGWPPMHESLTPRPQSRAGGPSTSSGTRFFPLRMSEGPRRRQLHLKGSHDPRAAGGELLRARYLRARARDPGRCGGGPHGGVDRRGEALIRDVRGGAAHGAVWRLMHRMASRSDLASAIRRRGRRWWWGRSVAW